MKITFIRFKRLIIVFLSLAIPLTFISIFRIEYSFTAPGFNDDISTFIVVNSEFESSGSFHTTSVISVDKITILQYLIGQLEFSVTVDEFPEYFDDIDIDDLNVISYLMKDDSLYTSLIVGIMYSGSLIDFETYSTVYLTFDYLDEDSLVIGDKILEINGQTDLTEVLNNIECLDVVSFKVLRDGEELTVTATSKLHDNGTCSIGVYLKDFSEIISTEVDYTLIDTVTGGPSGGLMQSLYIYNELTEFDITHGLKIAGTGTIDVLGNVGYIGGVKQKILTADINGIDIFFIPYLSDTENDNYIEALEVYNSIETDMILVGISDFSDALEYLLNYESGETND